jgi:hypothetical protein
MIHIIHDPLNQRGKLSAAPLEQRVAEVFLSRELEPEKM